MAKQKITSTVSDNVPATVVAGGGTTSRTGFSTIRFGEFQNPGGLYNGYIGYQTGFTMITGTTLGSYSGLHKLVNINISSPFSHRTPNYKTTERTTRYSSIIMLVDGRILDPGVGIISNSGVQTAVDDFGSDYGVTSWTSPGIFEYLSNGKTPATGYYS